MASSIIRNFIAKKIFQQKGAIANRKSVDFSANALEQRLKSAGINPNDISSEKELNQVLSYVKQAEDAAFDQRYRVISGDTPEGRKITEGLFGKRGEVVDMAGKKLDTSQGIMGGKSVKELMDSGQVIKGARDMKKSKKVQDREMFQDANKRLKTDVNKIIADIKAMDPMDSMKEANSVIGRKGVYKNLTPEESKKILKDTEDHIFERDIPEKDFADGGVAGLLGERPGYQDGNTVLDKALALGSVPYNFAKGVIGNVSNPGAVTQVSLTQAQKNRLNEIAQAKGTPTGTIDYSDYGSPTKTFSGISNMTPLDASLATTMGGTGFSINRDGSVNYTGGAYDFNKGNVITDFIDRGGIIGAADRLGGKIYDTVNPEDDEYDFSDIEGQTAFVGLPEIFALGKTLIGPLIKGGSASAVLKNAAKEKLKREIGKKIYKDLQKKITKPKYGTTSPTTKTTGGGSFDPSGPTQASIRASRGDKSGRGSRGGFTNPGKGSYGPHMALGGLASFADGGPARQNFAMGKRAFLKAMLGAGAGIAGLKSGLIGMGGKEATKKAVTETVKSAGSTPPPYFFKLAEKIKKLGSDTTPTNDRTIAKSLKSKDGKSDYILEEDVASGDTIIKKVNKEGDEMITDVQIMELRKGEIVKGKDGKARKTPDEYEEVTEANARIEGDVFNDPYYSDGIEIDDILREVDDIPIPKASGGIARMLGE
jgi:hypothetical protein